MSVTLRPYQERGVADIRAAYARGRKSVALVSPTGSGKTVVMTYIAHGATAKGNRITIAVHRQELIRQTAKALQNMGVEFGVIAAGHDPNYRHPVQLAMIQTLANRLDVIQPPNLLMIDECHHSPSETYRGVIARFPLAKILGLTATPQRLDGRGLSSIFEELVLGPTVRELIDQGFLCRPRYYAPPTELDMTGVHKTAGDFNKRQMEERVDRPKITGSAVEHYLKLSPGMPAVAFCASVKHAEHVRDQFVAAGVAAASIDGKLSDDDREDRVAALTDGRIKVLTSVDVISEGFDLPAVTTAILLRPTESLALDLQQKGRVLRPSPRKEFAIILDHVGNCMRHGLAEEDREWKLEGRAVRRASNSTQISLLTCSACNAVQAPAECCSSCGQVFPVTVRDRTVAEVDGSLAELTAARIAAERAKVQKRMQVGMAKSRADLEAIAKERGYDPKWVNMMLALRARKKFAKKIDQRVADTAQRTFL